MSEDSQHDDTLIEVESCGSANALGGSNIAAEITKQKRMNLKAFIIVLGLLTDAEKTAETDQKFFEKIFGASGGHRTRQLLLKMRNIWHGHRPSTYSGIDR